MSVTASGAVGHHVGRLLRMPGQCLNTLAGALGPRAEARGARRTRCGTQATNNDGPRPEGPAPATSPVGEAPSPAASGVAPPWRSATGYAGVVAPWTRLGSGASKVSRHFPGIRSCVFCPIDVLPAWAQRIARWLPSTYVFEGLRTVLRGGELSWTTWVQILGLNGLALALGAGLFLWMFHRAGRAGRLGRLSSH